MPAFRRDPWLALPALLSTIPWWPVTVSAVALIWTGPLAWAPIALATGAALLGATPSSAATPAAATGSPRSSAWLAAGLTALVTLAAAWSASPRVPGGDEPHYLAIAQSLLRDHDLRIENNHHDPDFVAAFGDLKPDFVARGRDGEIYSIHAPGRRGARRAGVRGGGLPRRAGDDHRAHRVDGRVDLAHRLAHDPQYSRGLVRVGRDRRVRHVPASGVHGLSRRAGRVRRGRGRVADRPAG